MRFYSLYLFGLLMSSSSFMFSGIQHSDEFKKIFVEYAKCVQRYDCDYRELRHLQGDIEDYESEIPNRLRSIISTMCAFTIGWMILDHLDIDYYNRSVADVYRFSAITILSVAFCRYGEAYFNGTIEREEKEKAELRRMKRWIQIELEVAAAECQAKTK